MTTPANIFEEEFNFEGDDNLVTKNLVDVKHKEGNVRVIEFDKNMGRKNDPEVNLMK
jgi:hypothetical protein